jgi:hypothetical protein
MSDKIKFSSTPQARPILAASFSHQIATKGAARPMRMEILGDGGDCWTAKRGLRGWNRYFAMVDTTLAIGLSQVV